MSTQIAVRLPDDMVASMDIVVADGGAKSRAELVQRAIRRELLLRSAERDAAIYARQNAEGFPDDMDGLAAWVSAHPVTIED